VFLWRSTQWFWGGQDHYDGLWKGWALEMETFWGPETATGTSEASAIWARIRQNDASVVLSGTQCCGFGSGIRYSVPFWPRDPEWVFFRIPDLGSRIPNPYFLELSDNFLGKKFYNSLKIGPNFFLQHFKNKLIYNFVKFVVTNKVWQHFFSPLCLVAVFGSGIGGFEIRDPGSGMGKNQDPGSGKHPGSATLLGLLAPALLSSTSHCRAIFFGQLSVFNV
jgi:hypothetical protein